MIFDNPLRTINFNNINELKNENIPVNVILTDDNNNTNEYNMIFSINS
jgi:hypothetical protein